MAVIKGREEKNIPSTQGNTLTKRPTDNSPSAATSLSSSYCASYTLRAFVVTQRGVAHPPMLFVTHRSTTSAKEREREREK